MDKVKKPTRKQFMWLAFYLGEAKFNATQAARLAGYKCPRSSGFANLHNEACKEAIARWWRTKGMGADEVLGRLADQARGSLESFIRFIPVDADGNMIALDDAGQPVKEPAQWLPVIDLEKAREAEQLHLLHRVKQGRHGLEIELHDVQHALELIGRHLGLFVERLDVRVEDVDAAIERELARLAPGGQEALSGAAETNPDPC